jgi:ribonuclease VapC
VSESYVLDASAVLCLLQEEKRAERVAEALPDAMIGAVNYSEVVAKLIEAGLDEATVDSLIDQLQLKVIPFDRIQARLAGSFRATTRKLGLSLRDRACSRWLRPKARRRSPAHQPGRNSKRLARSRRCGRRRWLRHPPNTSLVCALTRTKVVRLGTSLR